MSIAEKLQTIAENEQRVYDAGYQEGYVDAIGETEVEIDETTAYRKTVPSDAEKFAKVLTFGAGHGGVYKVTKIVSEGANVLPCPYVEPSGTEIDGITYTYDEGGVLTLNGMSELWDSQFKLYDGAILDPGTYTIKIWGAGADVRCYMMDANEYGGSGYISENITSEDALTFTIIKNSSIKYLTITLIMAKGVTFTDYKVKVLLVRGETIPDEHIPYVGVIDTLNIPEAVQATSGYFDFVRKMYISDEGVETDISQYLTDDNIIKVEGGGSIVANIPNRIPVPSKIEYAKKSSGGGSSGGENPMQAFINARDGYRLFSVASGNKTITDPVVADLLNGLDTSVFTTLAEMFNGCGKLTSVPLFDTKNVTSMVSMFSNCYNLTSVPLFDTKNVKDMRTMFYYCSNLTSVPLFDTKNVKEMTNMFGNCSNLTSVPLFDTRNVTNLSSMLSYCSKLTAVPAWDVRSNTTFSGTFNNCIVLTDIRIKNIKAALQVGSGTSYGHLLTVDSLVHLCYELRNVGSAKTLTVGSANLEKLADVYVKPITITDEMRAEDDLIDEKLPFVRCESTDEGATLITDYVMGKNWSIK